MIDLLQQQLAGLVAELHTLADPDAAEAHIQSVTADAAESIAAETARATRAEEARWDAETLRGEAEAAAEEATQVADDAAGALTEATQRMSVMEQELTASVDRVNVVTAQNEALQEELTRTGAALYVAVGERDAAEALYVQAEELREVSQAELLDSRAAVVALTGERDNAVSETVREKAHADERIADLRAIFEEELVRLRGDLEGARDDAREQRSRSEEELDRLRADLEGARDDAREQRSRADRAEEPPR